MCHDFIRHEVLLLLCNILSVQSVSVKVVQLIKMCLNDIHHKINLQKAAVHSVLTMVCYKGMPYCQGHKQKHSTQCVFTYLLNAGQISSS